MFCWLDIIPHTGWAGSGPEFRGHLTRTVKCLAADGCSASAAVLLWLLCCACALLFPLVFLVVCRLDGTLHFVGLCAMVAPLAGLFRSVFSWDGSQAVWDPSFHYGLGFVCAGLLLITCSLTLWSVIYCKECKQEAAEPPTPPPPPATISNASQAHVASPPQDTAPLLTAL